MLSVIDVIRTLSELIETNFPDFPVNDRDLTEDFPRPSYFIDVDEINSKLITHEFIQETSKIQVYFFAQDIYSGFLTLLKVKNDLLKILSAPAEVYLEGEVVAHVVFSDVNIEINKADKVLICEFSTEFIQSLEHNEDATPYMEILDYRNEVE